MAQAEIIKQKRVLTFDKAISEPLTHWNRKYGIDVWEYSFLNDTCTHSTEMCRRVCYSKNIWKNIRPRYEINLAESKKNDWVDRVVSQIDRRKIKWIRIHTMGDFYSQAYLDKWVQIAKQRPKVKILAYTRNWEIDASKAPKNFVIYYSIDPTTSNLNPTIHRIARLFNAPDGITEYKHGEQLDGYKLKPAFICSSHCENCRQCWSGKGDIAFPARTSARIKFNKERMPYVLTKDKSKRKYYKYTPNGDIPMTLAEIEAFETMKKYGGK